MRKGLHMIDERKMWVLGLMLALSITAGVVFVLMRGSMMWLSVGALPLIFLPLFIRRPDASSPAKRKHDGAESVYDKIDDLVAQMNPEEADYLQQRLEAQRSQRLNTTLRDLLDDDSDAQDRRQER